MAISANVFTDAASAASDLFGAVGDAAEADAYGKAAMYAGLNEQVAKQSTAIQETQASRSIYQSLGGINAAAEGNGLVARSGAAGNIYRSSVYQGALTKQLIGRQGLINENSFAAEQASYKGMQSAAEAAAAGGAVAGAIQGAGAVAGLFGL